MGEAEPYRKTYTPLEEVDCPSVFLGFALPHHVGSTSWQNLYHLACQQMHGILWVKRNNNKIIWLHDTVRRSKHTGNTPLYLRHRFWDRSLILFNDVFNVVAGNDVLRVRDRIFHHLCARSRSRTHGTRDRNRSWKTERKMGSEYIEVTENAFVSIVGHN